MKLTCALALFLFSGLAFAGDEEQFIRLRSLQVSEQCTNETLALYADNPDLVTAANAFIQEAEAELSDPLDDCSGVGTTTVACAWNFGNLNATQNLKDVCVDVGGQVFKYSDSLACSGNIQGQSVSISFTFQNVPECVAQVCDLANADELVNTLLDDLKKEIENQIPGFKCSGANDTVGEQCENETVALYDNNPDLEAAAVAFVQEAKADVTDPLDDCSGFGTTTVTCSWNFGNLTTAQNLTTVCVDVGGQVYEYSDSLTCSGNIYNQSASVSLTFEDIPTCVAQACNLTNVDEFVDTLKIDLEKEVEKAVPGLQCSGDNTGDNTGAGNTSGASTVGVASPLTLMMTGAAFFTSLFL